MKNRKNNKGFSLVELIVVVAIMAVLVGVLAPAYLSYVEKSRKQKDASAVEEVRHAVEIALAEEAIYDEVEDGDIVEVGDGVAIVHKSGSPAAAVTNSKLEDAVTSVVGDTITFESKAYDGLTITITIDFDTTTNTFDVEATGMPS